MPFSISAQERKLTVFSPQRIRILVSAALCLIILDVLSGGAGVQADQAPAAESASAADSSTELQGSEQATEFVPIGHFGAMIITVIIVIVSVLVHYEGLGFLTRRLANIRMRRRLKVLIGILGIFAVHIVEIWIFALGYYFMDGREGLGSLLNTASDDVFEYAYYSAVTYSTLGFGDITPIGPLRFLTAMEALCGLVLITWSASFTYLEMERYWKISDDDSDTLKGN